MLKDERIGMMQDRQRLLE